ncbi:hypothetical protein ACLMJK_002169 [Lecanora helva]
MGPIVRLVGSGIGLASEAIAARKASKAEKEKAQTDGSSISHERLAPSSSRSRDPSPDPPAYSTLDPASAHYGLVEAEDENHARQLVEKGHAEPYDQLHQVEYSDEEDDDDEAYWELDERAAALEDAPPYEESDAPAYEVRDPSKRSEKEEKPDVHKIASPVFEVVFVGGHLIGYVPTLSAQIASMVVQLSAGAAMITQSRHRVNTFLDEINNTFFRPRGLYAMLMTYKPTRHSWTSAPTDITQSIAKSADPEGLSHKFTNNLKFSGGKSHTEIEIPKAAPLIFPALDAAVDDANPETAAKKENAFKKSGKFIGEYMDHRAQAEYNYDNPNSSLSVPEGKPFASRYSDPNHPANSGSLISLVTGGKVDPRARRRRRGPISRIRKATGTDKPIRKYLRQDVLYLMIVNMPTEEELTEAKRRMEVEKKEKKERKKHEGGEEHEISGSR